MEKQELIFPKWADPVGRIVTAAAGLGALYFLAMAIGIAHPTTQRVGYAPTQPLPFSHAMHVGQLGLDCRYCHNTVEQGKHSSIPPTQTCINCHAKIKVDSPKLEAMRDSYETGMSIDWVRVHDLPDFVYFNHSAHIARGIGCVSCHGRIDKMETVTQAQPLTMGWCLDCHRAPEQHLRPLDKITDLAWEPEEGQETLGKKLLEEYQIRNLTDCSTCHR